MQFFPYYVLQLFAGLAMTSEPVCICVCVRVGVDCSNAVMILFSILFYKRLKQEPVCIQDSACEKPCVNWKASSL